MTDETGQLQRALLDQAKVHRQTARELSRGATVLESNPATVAYAATARRLSRQQTIRALECRANARVLTAVRDTDAFPEQSE